MPSPLVEWWRSSRGETRDAPTSGLSNPAGWMLDAFSSGPTPSGKRVTVDRALGLAPVFAAVSIISEQVGQLPLKVYKDVSGDWVEAPKHPAWRLLHDRPNEYTTAGRFWATSTLHLLLWGNAFVLKLRSSSSGLVDELWLLEPKHVSVKWDAATRTKWYRYEPADGRNPQEFSSDQVIHIFGPSLDGLVGMSVIAQCRASIGAALSREEFEGSFYRNGAVLSGIIEHPGQLSAEGVENLKSSFRGKYQGADKAGEVPVLEENATFKPIGSPLRDLEFVASQQLTRTDIAVMFKLPPHFLGGSTGDSLTYNTVEQAQIQFAVHAIAPLTTTIAQSLSTDPSILPQHVFRAEFVLEAMLRADANARAEFYEKMTGMKAMTVDEVRARENLGPLPRDAFPDAPPVVQVQSDMVDMIRPGGPPNGNGNGATPDQEPVRG
jgi:HK97 family phage portal protein